MGLGADILGLFAAPFIRQIAAIAGENLIKFSPVSLLAPNGNAKIIGNVENEVECMVGLTRSSVNTGQSVDIFLPGQIVPGFIGASSLILSTQYFAHDGQIKTWNQIPAGGWFRSIGAPISG